jgi:hypothetical protein
VHGHDHGPDHVDDHLVGHVNDSYAAKKADHQLAKRGTEAPAGAPIATTGR